MKLKLSSLATIAAVALLALVGVLKDVGTGRAGAPPIVPFTSSASDSVDSTALGAANASALIVTNNPQGSRVALPWIFAGPGFWVDQYSGTPGATVGTVVSDIDVDCDGFVDHLYADAACSGVKYQWKEREIDPGLPASELYLKTIMPPYPWIFRQRADLTQVCLYTSIAVPSISVLNTTFEDLTISPIGPHTGVGTAYPDGHTQIETTILGGAENSPPSGICLDSPQNSTSDNNIRHNPPPGGASAQPSPRGVGNRIMDKNSGLYVKWTIFSSFGSASLIPRYGDVVAPYASPPSIASDNGYVERTVQMDCWWLDDTGIPGNEVGTQCNNNTDDDFDGLVNDGCPKVGTLAETGAQCADAVDANEDGAPDKINDGCPAVISAKETWNDPDLLAMCDPLHPAVCGMAWVDPDGDCLMTNGSQQTGWFGLIDTVPVNSGTNCVYNATNQNQYSVPAPTVDTAADMDCDGLLNGVEWAYGTNLNNKDTDGDGASDFVEMFQFSNPTLIDTDGDGHLDKPASVYGDNAADLSTDNCPGVANPTQVNSDGHRRDPMLHETGVGGAITTSATNPLLTDTGDGSGSWTTDQWKGQWLLCLNADQQTYAARFKITTQTLGAFSGTAWSPSVPASCPGGFGLTTINTGKSSNPNQDKLGDACDPDDDNDQAVDTFEKATPAGAEFACPPATCYCDLAVGTRPTTTTCKLNSSDPLVMDTDGDTVNDGAEMAKVAGQDPTGDPVNPLTGHKPTWRTSTGEDQRYYRGCHINLPASGTANDLDGDGILCVFAGGTDQDSDNGTHPAPVGVNGPEVIDKVEAWGYGVSVSNTDTDGDGCDDWVEIHDINGDRKVDSGDTGLESTRFSPLGLANIATDKIYDIDKNGRIDSGDTGSMYTNTCQRKTWGGCALGCPSEN